MAKILSENAAALVSYLQANPTGQFTADDLAGALGLTSRQVNGTATGTQRKGLTERVEVESIEKKIIVLTPAGRDFDVNAEKPAE